LSLRPRPLQSGFRWDRFGRPDPLLTYGGAAFPSVWWWDAERAGVSSA
jgi:microcin C transport system substrate-binding protein